MTKHEIASYLVSLVSIMESKDAAGGISRGPTLGREYEKWYGELRKIIDKEHEEDEARKSDHKHDGVDEGRTEGPSDQPSGSEPVRGSPGVSG